jgi:hypothetical protein
MRNLIKYIFIFFLQEEEKEEKVEKKIYKNDIDFISTLISLII